MRTQPLNQLYFDGTFYTAVCLVFHTHKHTHIRTCMYVSQRKVRLPKQPDQIACSAHSKAHIARTHSDVRIHSYTTKNFVNLTFVYIQQT